MTAATMGAIILNSGFLRSEEMAEAAVEAAVEAATFLVTSNAVIVFIFAA
jgi:hypothetical protein